MSDGHLSTSRAPLRVGVVGVGYLGKFHVQKYAAIPEARIVGLADLVPAKAKEYAEKVGAQVYADYRALLGKVDAVSIAVPTDRHYPIAKDFLSHGSDVLVEKPISSTLEEAEDLIATARRHGRILQVGHLERFNPAVLAVREKIRTPLFIESHRLTPFRGRGAEVDVVLDLMIHDLDLILTLVKSRPEHIDAVGVPVLTDKVDIANARVRFGSGCVANITASRTSFEDRRRMRIFQPESYLVVDYAAKKTAFFRREPPVSGRQAKIYAEPIEVAPGDALETEIRAFVRSSLTRTPPLVSGEEGKKALDLAMRVNEQIQANFRKIPSVISFYEHEGAPPVAPSNDLAETGR